MPSAVNPPGRQRSRRRLTGRGRRTPTRVGLVSPTFAPEAIPAPDKWVGHRDEPGSAAAPFLHDHEPDAMHCCPQLLPPSPSLPSPPEPQSPRLPRNPPGPGPPAPPRPIAGRSGRALRARGRHRRQRVHTGPGRHPHRGQRGRRHKDRGADAAPAHAAHGQQHQDVIRHRRSPARGRGVTLPGRHHRAVRRPGRRRTWPRLARKAPESAGSGARFGLLRRCAPRRAPDGNARNAPCSGALLLCLEEAQLLR